MALKHINTTVQTTPTLIAELPVSMGQNKAVQIYNGSAASIYIGDSSITTTGTTIGRTLAASGSFQLWLNGGDKIYAIAASATTAGSVVVTYSA
jgi:hypothetical protein